MPVICKGCGKPVGCSCQLINGLCAACRKLKKGATNVTAKAYHLFRMY